MAPCSDAMIENVITIDPDNTVQQAMEIFEIQNIRSLPVVDKNGMLVGLFGLRHVLLSLLPASATMKDGLPRLDFVLGAAPGIAKRLKKILPKKVGEIMDKNPTVLHGDTATWEALRVMALHGSPITIVEESSGKFVGMISRQSLLAELHRLMDEMGDDEPEGEV